METYNRIAADVTMGPGSRAFGFANLYGCIIGDDTKIGTYVEIQKGARVGNRCKISSHSFICEGVTIEDEVFIGHGVMFTNDLFPRATAADGQLQNDSDWTCIPTTVKKGASIGSGAVLLCGITVGENALIGAGAVVTKDVPANAIVAGNPAKFMNPSMSESTIPFLDLQAIHAPLKTQFLEAFAQVIDSNAFAGGPFVAQFEAEFGKFCGSEHAIGVSNGTDALWLAMLALGIKPGDEVITVSASFIATAEAISCCGATPVFVEMDPVTYTMDPTKIEAAITPRTKAIVPVHLYGQMADMDPIMEIAQRHGLPVIEDAAQAHGATYRGRGAGSIGDLGCFSFYPGKNLGALGEGGAVTTNNADLADRVRMFRDHGQAKKYYHDVIGCNGRLDGMQAAALSIKLAHLAEQNEARRDLAAIYERELGDFPGIVTPQVAEGRESVVHLYVVLVEDRDEVLAKMADRGVACAIHYPIPIHRQKAYAHMNLPEGHLPLTEDQAKRALSLPMFPTLGEARALRVAETLKSVVNDLQTVATAG